MLMLARDSLIYRRYNIILFYSYENIPGDYYMSHITSYAVLIVIVVLRFCENFNISVFYFLIKIAFIFGLYHNNFFNVSQSINIYYKPSFISLT